MQREDAGLTIEGVLRVVDDADLPVGDERLPAGAAHVGGQQPARLHLLGH